MSALGELSFSIPIFIGMKQLKKNDLKPLLRKGFSPSIIPILVLLPFCMQTFTLYMTLPLHSLLYELFGDIQSEVSNAASLEEFAAQVVTICVLPAVMEELLCRGVITEMLKTYGQIAAMLVSALAFAMLHFSMYSLPIIFMMGVLLSTVKILTGSLGACMLVHFSNNFFSLLTGFIPEESVAMHGIINFAAFALFPLLIMRLLKKCEPEFIGGGNKKIKFSPIMCVCIALFAAVTIFTV